MAILDNFKPDRPIMKIAMMGPRAVGKTTILTAVFNETKTSIATTMLKLTDRGDTGKELQDRLYWLKSVFKKQDMDKMSRPNAGLAATATEHLFQFSFGILGKDPSIDLEIKDFPGEYVVTEPERVKSFINESTAIFIAIDTPHLMEQDGKFNEVKNKTTIVTHFFKEALEGIDSEKLVILIPLKCEKYFWEKRMEEVLNRVESTYADLISLFRKNMMICCTVSPILTLGDVVFENFKYDAMGNVELDVDGTPNLVRYKFVGEQPKYSPRFCSQPLYATLSFLAAQYTRHKNREPIWKKLLRSLWKVFKNDDQLFQEVLKMEKNRLSDQPTLGYRVLCGGEFFHYDH